MDVQISDLTWHVDDEKDTIRLLGFHVHYDGQETAVRFLEDDSMYEQMQASAVLAKLRQLIEALVALEQSPQQISAALGTQS